MSDLGRKCIVHRLFIVEEKTAGSINKRFEVCEVIGGDPEAGINERNV